MKKKRAILISTTVMLLLSFSALWLFLGKMNDLDLGPIVKTREIHFQELGEQIYIRTKAWGLAGNHEEIALSASIIGDEEIKRKEDVIVFNTPEIYYKKEGIDTLHIYVAYSSVGEMPILNNTRVKVVVTELKSYDEMIEYDLRHKEFGLKKMDVY